jgi:hypothetical protein
MLNCDRPVARIWAKSLSGCTPYDHDRGEQWDLEDCQPITPVGDWSKHSIVLVTPREIPQYAVVSVHGGQFGEGIYAGIVDRSFQRASGFEVHLVKQALPFKLDCGSAGHCGDCGGC